MKKLFNKKYLLIALSLIIITSVIASAIYLQPSKADNVAFEEAKKLEEITITQDGDVWVIKPKVDSKADMVFYTGGLVEEKAYIYKLARVAAQETITIYIPKINLNLAILDLNAADKVIKKYNLKNPYVGGHSLGAYAACNYTKDHKDSVKGLIMFAGYCESSIKDFKGDVLSLVGDRDGVINFTKKDNADKQLPELAQVSTIPGLNHAQFGNYGNQRNDREAIVEDDLAAQEIVIAMQSINWGGTAEPEPIMDPTLKE